MMCIRAQAQLLSANGHKTGVSIASWAQYFSFVCLDAEGVTVAAWLKSFYELISAFQSACAYGIELHTCVHMLVCACVHQSICVEDVQVLCTLFKPSFRSSGGGDQCVDTGIQHWCSK